MSAPSEHLLDTVVDLLARHGFEGISIRRVAAAAGVSVGAVQHHFPTRDALLQAAMDRISVQLVTDLERRVHQASSPAQRLHEVCESLLGLAPQERPAVVVWLQRLARAAVDDATAARHHQDWQQLEDALTELIADVRPDLPGGAARQEAAALLALLDGLSATAAVEPTRLPPDRARAILAGALGRLAQPG